MKVFKRMILMFMPLVMLAFVLPSVKAEEGTEEDKKKTHYMVTISSGLHGQFTSTGGDEITVYYPKNSTDPFPLGDYKSLVASTDRKYTPTDFHISGIEGAVATAGVLTQDTIFVMTYEVAGNTVDYKAEYYLDGVLTETDTYYGNIGDKPVVSYKYFDGYQPQAYNITGTLLDPASEEYAKPDSHKNVFRFYYTPVTAEVIDGGTTYRVIDEGGTITYVVVPGGGGGGGAAPGGGGAGPAPAPAVIPDNTPPAAGPEEIIDIDEPDTPSGNFSPSPTSSASSTEIPEPGTPGGGMSNAWKIALATGGGIGLLLLLLLLLRRKDNLSE